MIPVDQGLHQLGTARWLAVDDVDRPQRGYRPDAEFATHQDDVERLGGRLDAREEPGGHQVLGGVADDLPFLLARKQIEAGTWIAHHVGPGPPVRHLSHSASDTGHTPTRWSAHAHPDCTGPLPVLTRQHPLAESIEHLF